MKVWMFIDDDGRYGPYEVPSKLVESFDPSELVEIDDEIWETYEDALRLETALLSVMIEKAREEGKL